MICTTFCISVLYQLGLVKRVKRTCSLSKELDHKAVSNNFQEKNFLSSSFSSFSFNCYSIQHRKTYVKKVLPSPKVLQNFPREKNHSRTERTIAKAKNCYQICHYNTDQKKGINTPMKLCSVEIKQKGHQDQQEIFNNILPSPPPCIFTLNLLNNH